MRTNLGPTDRWIRALIGLALLAAGVIFHSWWGLLGLLPLGTAALGFCGLYTVCGLTTCRAPVGTKPGA